VVVAPTDVGKPRETPKSEATVKVTVTGWRSNLMATHYWLRAEN
jgi:hypothetical protein